MRKLAWLIAIPVALSAIYSCQKEINSDPALTSEAKTTTKKDLNAPILTTGVTSQSSIEIGVSGAAEYGAPAGFSIQWMTQDQLDALGGVWPSSDDPSLCKASFSGKANGYTYSLPKGSTVTLTFGDLLADMVDGGSVSGTTECLESMTCGTAYVFRVFAHADNQYNKSPFSSNYTASTADCATACGKHWFGYWKTHTDEWPQSVKDNGLMIGSINYTAEQFETILLTEGKGNGFLTLAHQVIAAKLNVANGAVYTGAGIATGDSYIGSTDLLAGTSIPKTKNNTWDNLSKELHAFNTTCD